MHDAVSPSVPIRLALPLLVGLGLLALASVAHSADGSTASFDGLVPVEGAKVAHAYIDPEADFAVFDRVKILQPHVAFRADWRRDQNRATRGRRISTSDKERIQADVAELFQSVFTEVLESDGGYQVVDEAGDDVLLLRPAIIDLDITAPDTLSGGRSRTFTSSTGGATLYIESYSSM